MSEAQRKDSRVSCLNVTMGCNQRCVCCSRGTTASPRTTPSTARGRQLVCHCSCGTTASTARGRQVVCHCSCGTTASTAPGRQIVYHIRSLCHQFRDNQVKHEA